MGDVYFDLANFAVNNDLPDEEDGELCAPTSARSPPSTSGG